MKKIFLPLILLPLVLNASTKLIVLGSGTPNPDPQRNGSAYAVVANDKAYLIDVKKEKALSKDPNYKRRLPLFIAEKDGKNLYVAPIRGKGLWDAIWAYVSMDENMVIRGIYFDHKGETPGLGANIKQRFFMDDFIGEALLDSEGKFKGVNVSKTNLDPKNEDKYDHEVDAIAGSTITGDGVTAMIRSDLSLYQSYFNNINN